MCNGHKKNICLSRYRKIHAILFNWKTADRIEVEFSLNKKAKGTKISLTDTTHVANPFSEILLQFASVTLILKTKIFLDSLVFVAKLAKCKQILLVI